MGRFFQPDIETADRECLRMVQSSRLRDAVRRNYERVPFYRRKLDEARIQPGDIQDIDDLQKLPFTYKSDLRDNYPYGLLAAPLETLARVHASSGTTGKLTVVGYTKHDLGIWADCVARAIVAAGGHAGDFVHVSYGYGLFTGGLGLHHGAERLGAAVIPASSGNTRRQVQMLRDFGSTILCCTPSYAMVIAEECRELSIDPATLPLRIGIFGAEAWSDNMRAQIERGLAIKAYDIYGLSEVAGPGVAFECEAQAGLHVCEDFFYPEVVDSETGKTLPDGEWGELTFTCIGKEALPLLRFRTRDICALRHERCSCGRTLVRIARLRGRADDMLIIRGVNVFPSQVEHTLLELGLEPNYRIIVTREHNLDEMTVEIEMSPALFSDEIRETQRMEQTIRASLHSALGVTAAVRLVAHGSIERFEGKAKRVIDEREI